jgi:transposase
METIRKVRLALARGESIHSVAKKYCVSRNTVRKIARTGQTEFTYSKRETRRPALSPYLERLREIMEYEMELPSKKRRTAKKICAQLQGEGYEGGYDAVRRYISGWKEEH